MTVEVNNGLSEQKGEKTIVSGGKSQEAASEEKRCSRQKPDFTTKDGSEEEKKDQGCHMVTRTSSRVAKRPRRDLSPPPSPPKKAAKETKTTTNTPETKTRRPWELWSTEDKDTFFEGLYEFGKDFDAIQTLIAQKHRKKGDAPELIKNKDQVRHFYYRTWHKISKYIDVVEEVKEQTLQLYGLINYGELRRRVGGGSLDPLHGHKLNELIHKGATTVKAKGKTFRLKTPVCRALKKLNNVSEAKETEDNEKVKLPEHIVIELQPKSNAAWAEVHAMAQNPRVRFTVKPDRRLSCVIDFLNKKWKSQRVRMREELQAEETVERELRLLPPAGTKMCSFAVTVPSQHRVDLTLENYKENIKGMTESNSSPPVRKGRKAKEKAAEVEHQNEAGPQSATTNDGATMSSCVGKKASTDTKVVGDHGSASIVNKQGCDIKRGETLQLPQPVVKGQCNKDITSTETTSHAPGTNLQHVLGPQTVSNPRPKTPTSGEKFVPTLGNPAEGTSCDDTDTDVALAKLQSKGWGREDAEHISIAEMYLMMGKPSKIRLEYDWFDIKKTPEMLKLELGNMLRRLVHIATTEFADFTKSKQGSRVASPPRCTLCGATNQNSPPTGRVRQSPRSSNGARQRAGCGKNAFKQDKATNTPRMVTPASTKTATLANGKDCNDPVFRVPTAVPIRPSQVQKMLSACVAERNQFMQQMDTVNKHADILLPKRNKKINRPVRKPLIVQRTLLPKAQVPTRQIMTLTMLPNASQLAQTGSFLPVLPGGSESMVKTAPLARSMQGANSPAARAKLAGVPRTLSGSPLQGSPRATVAGSVTAVKSLGMSVPMATSSPVAGQASQTSSLIESSFIAGAAATAATPISGLDTLLSSTSNMDASGPVPSMSTATSTASSLTELPFTDATTPNISSLLEISLPAPEVTDNPDKLLDLALGNSQGSFSAFLDTSSSSKSSTHDPALTTPPIRGATSDSHETSTLSTLSVTDNQWLNGDEFSLSTLLSDSPLKKSDTITTTSTTLTQMNSLSLLSESSRDSMSSRLYDVDSTLQCMMNENSIDYVTKFADLARQIAETNDPMTRHREDSPNLLAVESDKTD